MSDEINTLSEIRIRLLLLAILCFVIFLLISILLAKRVTRPVEKAWKQQKQFVSDVSHELKTPLTVILTNAELLRDPELDGREVSRYTESILIMSRRMRSLTEHLLELARLDNDIHSQPFTDVNMSRVVNEAILPFDPLFYEKGLIAEAQIEDGITIRGNEEQLCRMTDILLDNAGKYSDSAGTVRIILRKKKKTGLSSRYPIRARLCPIRKKEISSSGSIGSTKRARAVPASDSDYPSRKASSPRITERSRSRAKTGSILL